MANTVEIPAENEATTTPAGASGVTARRIVKAATPKASEGGTNDGAFSYPGPDTPNGLKSSNDDDDFVPIGKRNKREDDDDQEKWRKDRLKATEKRGKALRDKELQARREANTVNKEQADASGNPFSRFLSVFSVESKFPEHKRSFEATSEEDEEGPSEKRLKPNDLDSGERMSGEGAPSSLFASKTFWITTAVTVAVGVAFAVQRGRNK